MKHLQHVLWSKGTFLTPQHLQVQDRYMENLLQFQLESFSFRLWGFATLQIDEAKLVEGQFQVRQAKGIFPDGLLFDIPEADQEPPARRINDFFEEGNNRLGVYLSVPEHRDNGMNVGAGRDTKTRFFTEVSLVRDENTGLSEKPVQIARKNLRLLLGNENHEGSAVMQMAMVEKSMAGTYKLAAEFVPPMIDVHGNEVLKGVVRGLVETLGARSNLLSATRRQRKASLADFTVSEIANFWLLYTINHHLPWFQHLFVRQTVHPEQLFSAMLSLAGALTTFSTTIAPRDLPEYDHEQLGQCFIGLEQKIRLLLDTVIPTNFIAIPLHQVKASIHQGSIDDEKYLRDSRLYLAVSADVKDAELIGRVPELMKVAASGQVEEMIRHALPGLRMTFVSNPPSEVPVKLSYKYFSLELTGKVWEGIQRAQNLGVYVPAEFPNARLELIVLLPYKM